MIKNIEQEIDNTDITGKAPETEPFRQYYYMKKAKMLLSACGEERTYFVRTFGCQMNFRDSEKLEGILQYIGYKEGETEETSDVVILNTCTVRENANQKVYGHLGQLSHAKKLKPSRIIGICGCMMQEEDEVAAIRKSYPFVDLVFGTHNVYKLAELLYKKMLGQKRVIEVLDGTTKVVENLPSERKYKFKSGVNIMFGCNNFCSYCIVPYVRGRERSRDPQSILDEIRRLADDGVKEIMLLGQNVNSYGKTLETPMSFADLLRKCGEIDGIERIRFMTSHPKDLSDDLIVAMKETPKVCNHLHLPVQSGSSRILKEMNRQYTKESYLALVERIRKLNPEIALTTDIIVGFPGETDEDFAETLDLVKKVRYDGAYTFIYSKRSGTPAAKMSDQVPGETIKKRFDALLSEVQEIAREEAKKRTGSVVSVLVEEVNAQDQTLVTGRLSENLLVHFPGDASLIGEIVSVKLNSCQGFYYFGERV